MLDTLNPKEMTGDELLRHARWDRARSAGLTGQALADYRVWVGACREELDNRARRELETCGAGTTVSMS